VDGTLSVLQLAVADRLDDLVLSESELGASSLVAQGGALASPLGFEAVDDSPLPRNGLGNGAAGDDMVSDCAGCVESGTNRARLYGLALAVGVGEVGVPAPHSPPVTTWCEVPPVQRTVGPAYSGVRAGVLPSSR